MAARRKKTRAKKAPGARGGTTTPRQRSRGHRLAADVRPLTVDLELEVDPERSRVFRGRVVHELELSHARADLELHASDLRVTGAVVVASGRTLRAVLEERPERETVLLQLPERVGPGRVRLELRFSGRLRDDLRGLYYARAARHAYAFTQLEATDARRFFPCFDEPIMKAAFQLSVTTAAGHTVLSNSPIERTERLANGRKTVHFERTPPLSTYLLALAVGALEGSRTVRCGRTPIRVWHVPGKKALTAFALEAGHECLARLERYFGLPYPYAKLDLVAVPDFEAGAMENAGAVFFRETLLLVDPETTHPPGAKRVAEVVCHELAHMWYGDLVTMAWWDDLWLNEAFATWMAFHVVDDWKPEWKMWNDFQHYRAAALELDALDSTHPIYVDGAKPGRGHRELRPHHLREGRLGGAHDRALSGRAAPSARACAATSDNIARAIPWRPTCGERSPRPPDRMSSRWCGRGSCPRASPSSRRVARRAGGRRAWPCISNASTGHRRGRAPTPSGEVASVHAGPSPS